MTLAHCDELREQALAIRRALQAHVDTTLRDRHPQAFAADRAGDPPPTPLTDVAWLEADQRALAEELTRLIAALREAGCPELPASPEALARAAFRSPSAVLER